MSKKPPQTRQEIEAAASKWVDNLVGWKRQYVQGLQNEIVTLREKLARARAQLQDDQPSPTAIDSVLRPDSFSYRYELDISRDGVHLTEAHSSAVGTGATILEAARSLRRALGDSRHR